MAVGRSRKSSRGGNASPSSRLMLLATYCPISRSVDVGIIQSAKILSEAVEMSPVVHSEAAINSSDILCVITPDSSILWSM